MRVDKVVLVSWVASLTHCCDTPIEGAWITTVRALQEFEFIFLVGPRIQALACSMLLRDTRTWGTGGGAGEAHASWWSSGLPVSLVLLAWACFFSWSHHIGLLARSAQQRPSCQRPSGARGGTKSALVRCATRLAARVVPSSGATHCGPADIGCTWRVLSPAREVLWWARLGSSHGLVMAQDPSPSRSDAEQSLFCGTDLCSTRLGAVRTPVIVREPEHISAYLFLSYCPARCGLAHVPVKGRSSVTSDLCASRRHFSFSSILLQFCRQQCCMRIS